MAACVRVWLLHAGGLCGGNLRGDVLPSILVWKTTPLGRKGTFLQADKYRRAAPSGLPDMGSSGLAFSHSHLIAFKSSAGRKSINAHHSQDSQPDLQVGDIKNPSK